MASQAVPELLPIELHIVVGRNSGTAWTCQDIGQSCPIKLPVGHSGSLGMLHLRPLIILSDLKPNHGLLQVDSTATTFSFDKTLKLFVTAYSNTLEAEGFVLSKDNVRGMFCNYTNKNGLRVASSAYAPSEVVRNCLVFKNSYFHKDKSCDCGCYRDHHAPSIILILDALSWNQRNKGVSKDSDLAYTVQYRDDPMAKVEALTHFRHARLLTQQEIWKRAAKEEVENLTFEKREVTQDIERLQTKVDTLTTENKQERESFDQEVVAWIEASQLLVKENQVLEGRIATLTEQLKHLTTASATAAPNEKLVEEKEALETQIQDHAEQLQTIQSVNEDIKQKEQVARLAHEKIEAENKAFKVENETVKTKKQALKTEVLGLKAEIAIMKSNTTVMEQNHAEQLENLATQLRALTAQNQDSATENHAPGTAHQALRQRLKYVALKHLLAGKERDFIDRQLEKAKVHLGNQHQFLVMHEITELLKTMGTTSQSVNVQELEIYVEDILSNTNYASPIMVMEEAQQIGKKRKLDEFIELPNGFDGAETEDSQSTPNDS